MEPGELDRHLQLLMIGGSTIFPPNDPAPHFALTYGLHKRIAYLRSSNVTLPEKEDFLKLEVSKGVRTAQGRAQTRQATEDKVRIPSIGTAFQIESIAGTIARNKNGEPEQIVILDTSADISSSELAKAIQIRLLPKRQSETSEETGSQSSESDAADQSNANDENAQSSYSGEDESGEPTESDQGSKWQSPTDVPDDVLDQARQIEFTVVPSEKAQDRQHAFSIRVESEGELYVRVAKGVRASGDYPLAEDYNAIVAVPQLPREVQIEGQGGLLALNGDRKLSIRSRGLAGIEFEVARVATTQINHLVSQTEGRFEDPEFRDSHLLNQENISRIATRTSVDRAGKQMEGELLGLRFFGASSQTLRRRQRARAFLSDRARVGSSEKEGYQMGQDAGFFSSPTSEFLQSTMPMAAVTFSLSRSRTANRSAAQPSRSSAKTGSQSKRPQRRRTAIVLFLR